MIKLKPAFLITLCLIALTFDLNLFCLSLIAIFVHEVGHVLAIRLLGYQMENITLTGFGLQISIPHLVSYKNEALIAFAGPLIGLIVGVICSFFGLYAFSGINILYSILNLIPIFPLDGGRILKALSSLFFSEKTVQVIMMGVGTIALIGIWYITIWACIRYGLSLMLISLALALTYFNYFIP